MLLSTNGYSLIEGVRLPTPCSWVDLLIKLLDHSWINVRFYDVIVSFSFSLLFCLFLTFDIYIYKKKLITF